MAAPSRHRLPVGHDRQVTSLRADIRLAIWPPFRANGEAAYHWSGFLGPSDNLHSRPPRFKRAMPRQGLPPWRIANRPTPPYFSQPRLSQR